jgi:large subunit ribosomal protein L18
MAVGISNRHMYVQFIDDTKAAVLASVSTLSVDAELKKNVKGAQALGRRAGEIAKEKGIQTVVFDRGGRLFHGRVKAIAEGARETGLKF